MTPATVVSGAQIVEAGGTASRTTVASGELLISSGGIATDATIDAGATAVIAGGGTLETTIGGTAIISGTVVNSGSLFASGSGSLLEIASGTVVSGGVAVVGNGIVDIEGASKENVRFVASGSGGLDLGDPTAYTGKVAGFGGSSHANHTQFIDLTGVTFSSGVVSETYSGNSTGAQHVRFVPTADITIERDRRSGMRKIAVLQGFFTPVLAGVAAAAP